MAGDAMARETLCALRQTIARLEGRAPDRMDMPVGQTSGAPTNRVPGKTPVLFGAGPETAPRLLPFGHQALDEVLQGGLPLDAMVELRGHELRDAGAVSGFALALCASLTMDEQSRRLCLWIGEPVVAMETGLPHIEGLADHGLSPGRLLYAAPKKIDEALWLAEAALASRAFAAVLLEVRGNPARFGLTESRRLSLKARAVGRPVFVLRQAGDEEASSAALRLHIRPAPASLRFLSDGKPLSGSLGHPRFQLTVEKSRLPVLTDFFLEWNPHARQFRPADVVRPAALPPGTAAHPVAAFSASADRPDRAQPLGHVVAFDRAS